MGGSPSCLTTSHQSSQSSPMATSGSKQAGFQSGVPMLVASYIVHFDAESWSIGGFHCIFGQVPNLVMHHTSPTKSSTIMTFPHGSLPRTISIWFIVSPYTT
mmetsp:Transcript_132868/g.230394  ORF Transcript_132868/g.230394 Transcript_132868/m.230394 type:complete len:102 (+) Transcript_132868:1050-1355(+)